MTRRRRLQRCDSYEASRACGWSRRPSRCTTKQCLRRGRRQQAGRLVIWAASVGKPRRATRKHRATPSGQPGAKTRVTCCTCRRTPAPASHDSEHAPHRDLLDVVSNPSIRPLLPVCTAMPPFTLLLPSNAVTPLIPTIYKPKPSSQVRQHQQTARVATRKQLLQR